MEKIIIKVNKRVEIKTKHLNWNVIWFEWEEKATESVKLTQFIYIKFEHISKSNLQFLIKNTFFLIDTKPFFVCAIVSLFCTSIWCNTVQTSKLLIFVSRSFRKKYYSVYTDLKTKVIGRTNKLIVLLLLG